ncbi:MAG: hypothetical protein GYB68_16520 [Chloroflexi bacterium]|nr:hypothetical protein [Chloroflexota bacterium]
MQQPDPQPTHSDQSDEPILPIEIEVYINPDGSVTFADLEASVVPIAQALNPDDPIACDLPQNGVEPSQESTEDDDGRGE